MKKLLFLLLVTASTYGQTLQNPTYGNTTTNTIKIKTPETVTSVNFLSTLEADGSISKIAPVNLPFLNKVDLTPSFVKTIPYKTYTSFGDSYTFGLYVNYPGNKYPNIIGSFLNLSPYNYGVSGNQAADEQVKIYNKSISSSANELYTTIIGSNDINNYAGDLDKQDNYKNIYTASLAWLGIPNKKLGQSSDITYTGTWSNSTRFNGILSKQTITNGDKASFVINGTVAYISYAMIDGNSGTFTVTVDGVSTGVTYNCFGKNGSLISTLAGQNYGSGLIRLSGLSNADHTIELTVTSATSASNVVQFDWAGTNKGINTTGKPTTIIGKIVRRFSPDYIDDYNTLIQSIYATLATTDGMNFQLVNTDYVLTIPDDLAADDAHPNDVGMAKIAQPFIDKILSLYPQSSPVNIFSSVDKIDLNSKENIFKNKFILQPHNSVFESPVMSNQLADSSLFTSTGWTGTLSDGFTHTTGNTNTLLSTKKVIPNSLYSISFGFSGSGTGSVDVFLGGVKIGSALNTGIYNLSCKAVTEEGLKFVPTTDFVKKINDIEYLESYGGSESQFVFRSEDGTINNEFRSQKGLNNFSIGIDSGAKYYRGSNNFNVGYQANFNGVNNRFGLNFGTFSGFNSNGSGSIHFGEGSGFNDLGNNNVSIGRYITGDLFTKFDLTGNSNVMIGERALVSDLTADNQLSIMNAIYGTNLLGQNTSVTNSATAKIGLFIKNPLAPLHLSLNNNASETIGGVSMARGLWVDVVSSRSGITVNSTNGSLGTYGGNGFFNAIVPFDTFSTDRTFKPFRLQTGLIALTDKFYVTGYGEAYLQNAVSINTTARDQKLNVNGGAVFSGIRVAASDGLILDFDGTSSRLTSFFYSTSAYKAMELNALTLDFKTSNGSRFNISNSVANFSVPVAITPVPGTSAGTYDFVTRNASTFVLEKIPSANIATSASVALKEDTANKQNSLAVDATNTKFPTVTAVNTGLALKADLTSPIFTGDPKAPTQTPGDNDTSISSTAFVVNAISAADATNIKTTGNQSFLGRKTSANTGSSSINGIDLTNSGTGIATSLSVLNTSTGVGATFTTSGTGSALQSSSSNSGNAINVVTSSTGSGVFVGGGNVGDNFVSNQSATGSGFNYVGRNDGVNTFTVDKLGKINSISTYTALITQSSTGAPTVQILGNNTIGSIVWTRTGIGAYTGTLSGAFIANKTALINNNTSSGSILFQSPTTSTVTISTTDLTGTSLDGKLSNTTIKIEVYP